MTSEEDYQTNKFQTSVESPIKEESSTEELSDSLQSDSLQSIKELVSDEEEEEFVEGRPTSDKPGFNVTAASETEKVKALEHEEVEKGPYDPKKDLSRYKYPTLDLLNKGGDDIISIDKEEQDRNYHDITETLRSFGIEISSIKGTVGPTITLY